MCGGSAAFESRLECTQAKAVACRIRGDERDEVVREGEPAKWNVFEDLKKHLIGGFSDFVYATTPPSEGWPQGYLHRWTRHPSVDAG